MTFLRSLLFLVGAVPVTAVWNGVVSWLVMREARLRAMGPSAAVALVDAVFDDVPPQDEAARLLPVLQG